MTARHVFLPWVRDRAAAGYTLRDPGQADLVAPAGRTLQDLPVRLTVAAGTREETVDVALRLDGPGDVTGIDPRAVIRVHPPPGTADLEPNMLAFAELDLPQFPWLFTPAAAGRDGRLRPWLVLVVVRADAAALRPGGRDALPALVVPRSELPDPAESWAWAHAQVTQAEPDEPVAEILTDRPERNLSRLVCPRRLEPHTGYLACIVPAFAAGRRAGLGEPPDDADETRLAPAWSDEPQVTLPVYHSWRFGTGSGGDFESLARRLTGRRVPGHVGRRPLLVGDQPFGVPALGEREFEGPLVAPRDGDPLPPLDPGFPAALRDLLNIEGAAGRPVVAPPVHGSWQAAAPEVPADGEPPRWLREVNLDPALRAAAGLGARVVREQQEQLVAAAWQQLADAPEVRRLERRAGVAVAVLESVVRRHVATMDTAPLVQLLGPAHARLRPPAAAETVRGQLVRAGLPASFSSAPFRRVQRPAGTLARRRSPAPASPQRIVARIGTAVPAIRPPANAGGLVLGRHLGDRAGGPVLPSPGVDPALLRYRAAIRAARDWFVAFAPPGPAPAPPGFRFTPAVRESLVAGLEPQRAVARRLGARTVRPAASRAAATAVPAGPSFPRPMYETLRDLAPDLMLPGAGAIDADTVTLLESNGRFVEAFLLGLNHELAGELLWREFPGDLRHTYFRAFWDARGTAGPADQVPPIRDWDPAAAAGTNLSSGAEGLVLLVRGELLLRYPDALVYAVRARTTRAPGTEQRMPVFRGRLEPDITFLGFDLQEDEARGDATDPGWFFAIQEQPTGPRFGLDETRVTDLRTWNDLAWSDTRTAPGGHLRIADLAVPAAGRPPGPVWGRNAAHLASILRQRPVRLAFHARHLLPPAGA